jgi:efflux transporter, RND family, MFP subunit
MIINNTKRTLQLLLGAAVVLLLNGCSGVQQNQNAEGTERLNVKVALSTTMRLQDREVFSGTVEPFEQNQVSPAMAGRIDKVLVDVGDHVVVGQQLVQMDETQLLTARTQMLTLERDFSRLDTLKRLGSATQQQYDQMKMQLDVSRATVANLQKNTKLVAPITGIVTGRYYQSGELFAMSPTPESNGRAAILTVMQLNPVKVLINLPEGRLGSIRVGQKADVVLDAYPDRNFAGEVYRIAPTVHPLSHTAQVEIRVSNADLALKPGMFARVSVSFGEVTRVVVPDLAVVRQRGTNDRAVFLASKGMARRVLVKLGNRVEDKIEILDGLTENDSVIVTGLRFLQDGHLIQVAK